MRVQSIDILDTVRDILDDFVNVSVKLENGHTYVVVVSTQKSLLTQMEDEKSDFLSPGEPMIIDKKMTDEVVQKAIEAYAEDDAYYLKFYDARFDVKTLDVLKARCIARDKLLDDLLEKG